jgi:ATP-dependent helicase/DNAse subunit B
MRAAGELTSFNGVADKPGFTRVLLEWIREMKSQGIPPEQVSAHARTSGRERDHQLALLYQRYQAFLIQSDLSDPDGLLWLAAEALEADPDLGRSRLPFILLGFDHFNPLQLRILQQLVGRCPDFSIYLLWDPGREPGRPGPLPPGADPCYPGKGAASGGGAVKGYSSRRSGPGAPGRLALRA